MDEITTNDNNQKSFSENISRRNALKALAGIPIAGLFGYNLLKKINFDKEKKLNTLREIGLDDIKVKNYNYKKISGDHIRIGIIGFGNRANALAQGLGFLHPNEIVKRKENNTFSLLEAQEDLNVSIAGVCDVFDLHAQRGIEVAKSSISKKTVNEVKRYLTYKEMLADKNIDAVIIATPDHHHARMAIDAVLAGKHVYLEKTIAHSEEELNELYNVVKQSNITFQLGHQITQSTVFKQAKEIIEKGVLGKITLIETTTNRNSANGAWIRHLDNKGNPKPGDEKEIDWKQWLGEASFVPFSIDRYYNWTKWFDYDTGMIGQLFTHEFDAINKLLRIGIPKTVTSSGGIYFWKDNREIPDSLHCVFEYPNKDLTLMYSANLASSRHRGRVIMGHDASMEFGDTIKITVDRESTKFKSRIQKGTIETGTPSIIFAPNEGKIDALTSATSKYYADRGLTSTVINGQEIDITHLHLREWINCIREKSQPSSNIDLGYEIGITSLMAHRAYLEKRQITWDDKNKKIV